MSWFEDDKERRARESHEISVASHAMRLRDEDRAKRTTVDAFSFKRKHIDTTIVPDHLGRGRFAELKDLKAGGLLDDRGLFLGGYRNRPIFANGDVHLLTYGRTGSGKGRDVILPNLGFVENKSVVVVDPKNGENAYATSDYRRDELGHDVVFVDPFGLHADRFKSRHINPLQFVIDLADAGLPCQLEARYIAAALIPDRKGDGQEWVEGARDLVATRIEYLARFKPDQCTLSEVWRLPNCHPLELKGDPANGVAGILTEMMDCGDPGIEGVAAKALGWVEEAGRQFAGYIGQMSLLSVYRPGSDIARATDHTDFDVSVLAEKPTTLYFILPEYMLRAAAPWVSLMLTSIIERVARAEGSVPCLFLCDEVANLPKMDSLLTALKLYRSFGIQLWLFSQGRSSLLAAGYSEHEVRTIEDNCSVLQMWGVEEKSLLDDLRLWGGQTVVPSYDASFSGAKDATFSVKKGAQARPLLQAEDVRMLSQWQQLIRIPGMPIIKAEKKPWFGISRLRNALRDPRELFEFNG